MGSKNIDFQFLPPVPYNIAVIRFTYPLAIITENNVVCPVAIL